MRSQAILHLQLRQPHHAGDRATSPQRCVEWYSRARSSSTSMRRRRIRMGVIQWKWSHGIRFPPREIRQIIKDGACYINIHTSNYTSGEIRGNYKLAAGSTTFTPPPVPPSFSDDHTDAAAASRFLQQATFGPGPADVTELQGMASYDADRCAVHKARDASPSMRGDHRHHEPGSPTYNSNLTSNSWWRSSITGGDQLRQRVAFALSEILVTSTDGPLEDRANATSDYYDMLLAGHL